MTLANLKATNNGASTFEAGISSGITTLILETGTRGLFPTTFPFYLTLEKFNVSGQVTRREIVKVTGGATELLTIVRSAGMCPVDHTATTLTNTAQPFDAGDSIKLKLVAEIIEDLNAELVRLEAVKANQTSVDALNNTYAAASGGTDTYAFTIPGFVSYSANVGKTYRFLADVDNTGASNVNISGVGAVPMYKGLDNDTVTGDIKANQIVTIVIWLSGTSVQMTSQVDTIVDLSTATPPALYDTTFAAWEDLTAWNAVFPEVVTAYASATTVQSIGDVTARTRFEIPWFGSGVAGSTFKLSLKKFVSPSVALGVRIETDNAGSPSGTLVHANATGTVAAASLSTSLADTTVTLAGSFTIPAGQKVHIVLFQGTYGSETINETNYYGVGYSTNNTTTRGLKLWNGTSWSAVYSSVGSTNATLAGSSPQNNSSVAPLWLQYLAINDVIINTITKNASTAATKAYIKNNAWTILETMTFSGNVATPTTTIVFPAWTYFRVELDDNGASFANRREQVPTTYPQVGTDVSITSNSLSGANDPVGNQNNSIITINTGVATLVSNFAYLSGSIFSDIVLSKTDSDYSYKVDWSGISSESVTAGLFPKVTIAGINANQTGITHGSTYYINATPGSIGTSAGVNSKKIAKWHGTTKVNVIPLAL